VASAFPNYVPNCSFPKLAFEDGETGMVRLNQWPISGRQIACLSVQVGRMQPHYPSVTTDPHPVIRAIFVAPQLQTFIHFWSGGSPASSSAGRTVISRLKIRWYFEKYALVHDLEGGVKLPLSDMIHHGGSVTAAPY
jgi:hypothetical protein